MNSYYDFLMSPALERVAGALALVCLLGALAFSIQAFVLYGRARESAGGPEIDPPWGLVMGTLRDSFVITVLYACQGMLYNMTDFGGMSASSYFGFWSLAPLLSSVGNTVLNVLAIVVAVFRINAIRAWMKGAALE